MRWVFCGLFALTLASPAVAADFDIPPPAPVTDYDVLRGAQTVGPATFTRWSGFYAGGQIGLSTAPPDFAGATQSLVAFSLRETLLQTDQMPSQWPVLGSTNDMTDRLWRLCRLQHPMAGSDPWHGGQFQPRQLHAACANFADRTHGLGQRGQRLCGQYHRQRFNGRTKISRRCE